MHLCALSMHCPFSLHITVRTDYVYLIREKVRHPSTPGALGIHTAPTSERDPRRRVWGPQETRAFAKGGVARPRQREARAPARQLAPMAHGGGVVPGCCLACPPSHEGHVTMRHACPSHDSGGDYGAGRGVGWGGCTSGARMGSRI